MDRFRRLRAVLPILSLSVLLAASARVARAQPVVPPGFVDGLVVSVPGPTAMAFTPDGRLLVTQQSGGLRVVTAAGALLATPALTLSASQICTNSERGLLGVAVDPAFATNRSVFLFYTRNVTGSCATGIDGARNRVSRFVLPDSNVIDPGSEVVLIDGIRSFGGNHNAGDLRFGRDGYLYVSTGDGGTDWAGDSGSGGANDASRDEFELGGKILRVTRDGEIPVTNPFQGAGTARCNVTGGTTPGSRCQETYAWGFRNPFRFATDPNAAGTRIFVNDVGQNVREEVDELAAGIDYGWNCREGTRVNSTTGRCSPTPGGMRDPLFEYAHGATVPGTSISGCNSITGGAFVPNGVWPAAYDGTYLLADFICGAIFRIPAGGGLVSSATPFVSNLGGSSATSLLFGPYGATQALYYTTYAGGGQVRRLSYSPNGPNAPPVAAIDPPAGGPSFAVGETVTITGAATDPEDGTVPPASLHWTVLLHDGTQTVPFQSGTGAGIQFVSPAPASLLAATNSVLEVHLQAQDSAGLLSADVRLDLLPRKRNVSFSTVPAGARLTVNGEGVTAPSTVVSWEGWDLALGAPGQVLPDGRKLAFSSWSDGGAESHVVTTPAADLSRSATFALTGSAFHAVAPCRVADTRSSGGPLAPLEARAFPVAGACGIPATAYSVVLNVTAVTPTAPGSLSVFPGDLAASPGTSTVSFPAGRTRASVTVALLSTDGAGTLKAANGSTGPVDVVLDVSGYFE